MIINKANNVKQSFQNILDEKIFGNNSEDTILLSSELNEEPEKSYDGLDFDVDDSVFEIVNTSSDDEEEVKEAPNSNDKFGIAGMINSLIRDEWEAIDGYNSTLASLKALKSEGSLSSIEQIEKVITDIVNEENIHVGQLQRVLELVSPNASSIATGEKEATKQIRNSDALHPGMTVQTFEQPKAQATNNQESDSLSAYCTLSDIDDEF